ncbi:MAG: hypothetical protein GXO90_04515 [FCB group bacterium]|nr:hypothetical protein [FCB group bacterium]
MDATIKAITSRPLEEVTKVVRSDNRPKKRKKSKEQTPEDILIIHGENKEKHSTTPADITDPKSFPGHEVDIVVH